MILNKLLRLHGAGVLKRSSRSVSILSSLRDNPVLVSANTDIYTNLALEHWLYTNLRFGKIAAEENVDSNRVFEKPVVLIWTDEPCVVMGRHQNPWVEATLGFVNKANVKLARRHSGGGCVYHDQNNINISVIGPRSIFDKRQDNLKFLADVIDQKYGVKCEPTSRHDLIHSDSGHKMTGSAAKLGKHNCYHHFTLLVDTDKEVLYTSIRQRHQDFIHTNSSLSTRSTVINLRELKPNLEVNQVITDLANAYGNLYGNLQARKQAQEDRKEGEKAELESLGQIRSELESWDWIYGKTPKFRLEREFKVLDSGKEKSVKILVQINKGLFESIDIETDLAVENPASDFQFLIGTQFSYKESIMKIAKLLQVDESHTQSDSSFGTEQLFATFLLQMIHESNY